MKTPLNGYIKIYRQMLDWEWYDDVNTKAVFLHLLLTASFEDRRWHGIEVKKGDVITSIPSLANTLKLSERNIRTAIKHLKATGEVTVKAYAKFSVITVVNYNLYQENPGNNGENSNSQIPTNQVGDRQSDRQVTDKRQTSDNILRMIRKKRMIRMIRIIYIRQLSLTETSQKLKIQKKILIFKP